VKRTVDEFLAAPETLRQDEQERRRAHERKAKQAAEQARILAGKAKQRPTVEQMLADVVRVAEDAETNPWHAFRSISRRRYELFGHFPVQFLDAEFGTFTHALEVAGLRDQVGTMLWRRKRAETSRHDHASRYFARYVAPYVADRERRLSSAYLLLSISDTHGSMLDPFVWLAFLQAIRDLRPHGVLLNGDIIDDGGISRHVQPRDWTQSLASELAFQRQMIAHLRSVHDGDLWLTGGNHDLGDRLPRYLTQCAPALVGLPSLRIDELLGLREFDVRLMLGGSTLSPAGTEDAKPGFLLFGHYRVHHGTALGQSPAIAELRSAGRSGQSGHVHRASVAYGTNERDEALSWMSTPMGARHEVGRAYIKGTNTGWQRGIGVAHLQPDGTVHQYPAVVQVGEVERLTVEGFTYERRGLADPDPSTNWLETLRMPTQRPPAGKRAARSAGSTTTKRKGRSSR
jgi:hypothetical protein